MAFFHAAAKLRMLHRYSPSLDTKKLFAMSVLLSCLTRTMGFVTIGALNIQSIRIGGRGTLSATRPEDPDQRFYDKTMMVLFDLPDFISISAFTLLAVVWAEAYLQSRKHWLSSSLYKRQLLLGYMVFNAVLYAGQVVLYALLFLPKFDKSVVLASIYLTLTTVNFLLPILLVLLFLYLTCNFSGFPFKSVASKKRLHKVGRVVLLWTAARVVWAVSTLTAVLEYARVSGGTSLKQELYSVVVVMVFLVTELFPFVVSLDNDVLMMIAGHEQGGASEGPVG
ncbi:unnamed protein product [Choristocarpus tenellus]